LVVLTEDYKVRLDTFEGPLDLLLFLIRKNEVEAHDIPVATIASQYMHFLGGITSVDIDVAGEFLLMAATLTEIKSRMVAYAGSPHPTKAADGDETKPAAEDPRAELVRQLLAYKAYRDAASGLEQRQTEWMGRVGNAVILPNDRDPEVAAIRSALAESRANLELDDLELVDLTEAFRKVMETVNLDRLGDHQVTYDDTPIEAHADEIVAVLQHRQSPNGLAFAEVFKGKSRAQMVGLFLALLTLVRDRRVAVRQDRIEAAIYLELAPTHQEPQTTTGM
jgi:segregation and condensation protein A